MICKFFTGLKVTLPLITLRIFSRMGVASIQALMEGQRNVMIGIENDKIVYVPFAKAIKNDKPIDKELVNVLAELSI